MIFWEMPRHDVVGGYDPETVYAVEYFGGISASYMLVL